MLLNAYGWWKVSQIMYIASIAAFVIGGPDAGGDGCRPIHHYHQPQHPSRARHRGFRPALASGISTTYLGSISCHGGSKARSSLTMTQGETLSGTDLRLIDAWWRAANYLSVGQIYLMDNPLLREPLRREHIKPRLLGHWGTTPGLNFVYAHLNRVIKARDLNVIYICGPGHGGPGMVANTWLEGTYSELYPRITEDARGMRLLFRQFSFPGGIPSHASPETPGSIHEGGELGYSLVHAYGAACDNPDLIAACVIGDGEAETGPLAASWRCNTFLNPTTDGAVLPILHLNGYKIANPTILGRLSDGDVVDFFRAYGYEPLLVAGSEPEPMHRKMARALDEAIDHIWAIQQSARNKLAGSAKLPSASGLASEVPKWPMIVLRTPKGWTGPKEVDGKKVEGFWRSHQVPLAEVRSNSHHLHLLEEWMRSYGPQDLFDESGRLVEEIARMAPEGDRRMGANPHANGGLLRRELRLPDFRSYAVNVANPGTFNAEGTRIAGAYLRDVERLNAGEPQFPAGGAARDGVEPPRCHLRSYQPHLDGAARTL
jgi:xylulose-5-phosphate/fructose-6-phosphate phosphoketolase